MIECIRFRGRERRINIPQEVGVKYYQFGLLLLEDVTGARIRSIAHKHMKDAEQISMEVLEEWIIGRGKHPITWKTLAGVLHDIELCTLASEIEVVKCREDKTNGHVPVGVSDSHIQREISTVEGSEQRSTRDIPTAGIEDKHCETLEQRVVIAADLLSDSKDSEEKEKNQLAKKSEAEILARDSKENQEDRMTIPHGTATKDTIPLQDEVLD